MNLIRSAFLWLFMFLTIALMGPVHIFCGLFIDRTGALSYRIATAYLRLCLFYIGMKLRIEGGEHVPREGSFIVMPNHRSWWDIPAVQLAIYPRQLRFIYKKQLENIPILGWCIKVGGHIGIDREDRDRAVRVLRDVARRFSGRFSLVIFPEGTRSPGRQLLRFKRGGFHLSRELELPVIPVSISGSQVIQSRHTMAFHPGTVTVTFHPPVRATDFPSLDAMIAHVKAQVLAGLTDGVPDAPPAPAASDPTGSAGVSGALGVLLLAGGLLAHAWCGDVAPARAQALEVRASATETAPAPSAGGAAADPDTLAARLRAAGEDPAAFLVDPVGVRLEPVPRFPPPALADAARLAPLRAPALLRAAAVGALEELRDPAGALEAAALQQGHPVAPGTRRGVSLAAADRPRPGALFEAIAGFYSDGKRLDGKKRDDLRRFTQQVPEPIGRAAARLVDALRVALARRERAFREVSLGSNLLGKGGFAEAALTWVDSLVVGEPEPLRRRIAAAAAATDFEGLNAGAAELLRAVDGVSGFTAEGPPFSFTWDSPYGRIAINRDGDDRYAGDYLLIVDLDGNDTYRGGGRTTPLAPVSVILDLQGQDRYAPADSASAGPGGAIAGYALIDDRGGNDSYRAWRVGLGAGVFGVGMLLDRAGSDTLEALTAAEGAGFFGLGLLADLNGDDVYRVSQAGQGCGGPGGVGWLLDRAGNDLYEAVDRPRDVPEASGITDPVSRAQGAAFGLADGGAPWPGGCGLLADQEGNDRYRAGDAAQGYAELGGVGWLVDLRGDDDHDLATGGLGQGRQLGVGLSYDGNGRDSYACRGGGGLGAADHLGLGLCVDERGEDTYTLRENGLGCAAGPGLALFVDGGGDDRYAVDDPGSAFGRAVPPCSCEHALARAQVRRAFFLDGAGRDVYPEASGAGGSAEARPRDAATWSWPRPADAGWLVHGLGVDRP